MSSQLAGANVSYLSLVLGVGYLSSAPVSIALPFPWLDGCEAGVMLRHRHLLLYVYLVPFGTQ